MECKGKGKGKFASVHTMKAFVEVNVVDFGP
jgi:hypothetical protein